MKKLIVLIGALLGFTAVTHAQDWAIKTNLAYWGTTTINLGTEVALGQKLTIDAVGVYNPFTFDDNKKLKLWGVQPELRWWTCRKFDGHFFGIHGHYGQYNAGLKTYRYDGWLAGAGISYGYQFILGNRWNFEAEIGGGYARMNYDKYVRQSCGPFVGHEVKNYWGITRLSLSFVFMIN